ncbi:hypothetical protein SLEP1_g49416 [Rubroshorea leprosula]|uniref:Uncharacterized protein n=1 Tax=Rubroshorea leprosula TaxID=152421 RepID=A0AAV5LYT9_9ROSI|nr:hypothetical protein SLEP1_g49416 [Rubroshorea leprosula]
MPATSSTEEAEARCYGKRQWWLSAFPLARLSGSSTSCWRGFSRWREVQGLSGFPLVGLLTMVQQ